MRPLLDSVDRARAVVVLPRARRGQRAAHVGRRQVRTSRAQHDGAAGRPRRVAGRWRGPNARPAIVGKRGRTGNHGHRLRRRRPLPSSCIRRRAITSPELEQRVAEGQPGAIASRLARQWLAGVFAGDADAAVQLDIVPGTDRFLSCRRAAPEPLRRHRAAALAALAVSPSCRRRAAVIIERAELEPQSL